MRGIDLVREFFPDADEVWAEYILWGHTGYPEFWWGEDGNTPQDCCRTQLWNYRRELQEVKE